MNKHTFLHEMVVSFSKTTLFCLSTHYLIEIGSDIAPWPMHLCSLRENKFYCLFSFLQSLGSTLALLQQVSILLNLG